MLKHTDKKPLESNQAVPADAKLPWNLTHHRGLDQSTTFFMENPGMGLKASYRQVMKPDGDPSHCQAVLEHKGGVIAVCTTPDYSKIGFLPEAVRLQGIFDEFPRGFKTLDGFGIEASEAALRREMAEADEANIDIEVRHYLPLAKSVNVDNALIVHPVTGEGDQRQAGGNDYYLVIFPDDELVADGDGKWVINPNATVDKKMSGMVFVNIDEFDPANDNYGYGVCGFTLTGLSLFRTWKAEKALMGIKAILAAAIGD